MKSHLTIFKARQILVTLDRTYALEVQNQVR